MVRHTYQEYQGNDFIGLIVITSFSIFVYVCMCIANRYGVYINNKNQRFPEYVPDIGMSTGISMLPIYQMQIPKYRKPNSPKNTSMV